MSKLPTWADEGPNFHSLSDAKRAARLHSIRTRCAIAIDRWPIEGTYAYCVRGVNRSPLCERVFVMRPGLCDLSPYNFSPTEYNGNTGNATKYADGIALLDPYGE